MARDVDSWCKAMPDVSNKRAFKAWLDAMPMIESGMPEEKLIYKTVEHPAPRVLRSNEETVPAQTFRFLSDAEQSLWDTWLNHHLDNVVDAIGEETGALQRQLRDELRAEIEQLRAE